MALANELGLESCRTFTHGRTAFELGQWAGTCRGSMPMGRPIELAGTVWAMWRLNRLARSLTRSTAWGAARAAALDARSLGDWIDREVRPDGSRRTLRFVFRSLLCCDPNDVSLLFALFAVSRCGGLDHALAVEGGAQERHFTGTTGALIQRMAQALQGHIHLGHAVERIVHTTRGATLFGTYFTVRARNVVVAVPLPQVAAIDFEPATTEARRRLIAAASMGAVVKSIMVYAAPFWRREGLSGETWSDTALVGGTYDTTLPGTPRGILTALSSGAPAQRLGALNVESRRRAVLDAVAKVLGPNALTPHHYVDRVWAAEPWIGGGYAAHVGPGEFAGGFNLLREPCGPIHWAGTELAHHWPGYMEGAIESGERAAREVVNSRGSDPGTARKERLAAA